MKCAKNKKMCRLFMLSSLLSYCYRKYLSSLEHLEKTWIPMNSGMIKKYGKLPIR